MAGEFHIDSRVERALIQLNDEVCSFERQTGREYTMVFIPHNPDEPIVIALNGKPIQTIEMGDEAQSSIESALYTRKEGAKMHFGMS